MRSPAASCLAISCGDDRSTSWETPASKSRIAFWSIWSNVDDSYSTLQPGFSSSKMADIMSSHSTFSTLLLCE